MIKLNSIVERLEEIQMKIEDKIESIEERAYNRDSGMLTEKEEETIETLREEYDNIQNALDYLNEYTSY